MAGGLQAPLVPPSEDADSRHAAWCPFLPHVGDDDDHEGVQQERPFGGRCVSKGLCCRRDGCRRGGCRNGAHLIKTVMSVTLLLVVLAVLSPEAQQLLRGSRAERRGVPENSSRVFSYMTMEESRQLLVDGLAGGEVRYVPSDHLVAELNGVVNTALWRIRHALLSSADGPKQAPLEGSIPATSFAAVPTTDAARWWSSAEAHPKVARLGMTGGVCGGKTSATTELKDYLAKANLFSVRVPEIATVLFDRGAMNYGTYQPYNQDEYFEFMLQDEVLQLAFEELFARAAEEHLAAHSEVPQAVVMLTDRDALDGKAWTRPVTPTSDTEWSDILAELGTRLQRPGLSEADLVQRYQLGVVVLQTWAVVDGELNKQGYMQTCVGPQGSNPVRHQTVEGARDNDEEIAEAYALAYPADKICRVTNSRTETWNQKLQHVLGCVEGQIARKDNIGGRLGETLRSALKSGI